MRNQKSLLTYLLSSFRLVPLAGVEPARLAALDFESSASTNSATGALGSRRRSAGSNGADIIPARGPVNPWHSPCA